VVVELHPVVAIVAAVAAFRASSAADLVRRVGAVGNRVVLFLAAPLDRHSSVPTVAAPEAAAVQEAQPPADTVAAAVAVEAVAAAGVAAEDLAAAGSGADPTEPLPLAAGWAVHEVRPAEAQHRVVEHLPSFAEQARLGIVADTAACRPGFQLLVAACPGWCPSSLDSRAGS